MTASSHVEQNETPSQPERTSPTTEQIKKPKDPITWICTIVHLFFFVTILCTFHVIIVVSYPFLKRRAFDLPLELMCLCLNWNCLTILTRVKFLRDPGVPNDKQIIFIANHQSMYDIPFLIWQLRDVKPRFLAKKELMKGLPAISFSLRNGWHFPIDRKDRSNSLAGITEWGKEMNDAGQSACIFAEGTRARDGKLKKFKIGGFQALRAQMPSALVVPVSINGMWRLMRFKLWPLPVRQPVSFHVHSPIETAGKTDSEILEECYQIVAESLGQKV